MSNRKIIIAFVILLLGLTSLGAVKMAHATSGWTGTANSQSQTSCFQPSLVYSPHASKILLEYSDTNPSSIYCSTYGEAFYMHVLVSTDGAHYSGPYDVGYLADNGQISDMTYDPDNQIVYLAWAGCGASCSTSSIWLSSTSDGASWTTATATPFPNYDCGPSIAYDSGGHRLIAALSEGCGAQNPAVEIWTSTNQGGSWTQQSDVSYGGGNIRSYVSPEIRYVNGVFFLSYTDSVQGIHILQSTDLSTWTNKVDLPDTSGSTPTFSFNPVEGLYHIDWQGTDSSHTINDRTSSDAINWPSSGKYVTNQQSWGGPELSYLSSTDILVMGWTGTDMCGGSCGHENTMLQNSLSDNAQFVSQSGPPSTMNLGQQASVSVTMKNTGTTVWTPPSQNPYNPFRLGSQNPQDNTNWGFSRVDLGGSVAPGSQYTFSFTITAPSTTGVYNFQWRTVQDGVTWFGDYSPNVQVNVGNPTTIEIYTYPTTDIYCRSIGLAIDRPLPVPWWPPYQSGYEIGTPSSQGGNCGSLTYYTYPQLAAGSHYVQVAVSGSVPDYAWHAIVYVNGAQIAQGDVGRNQILQANFNV